MPPKSPESPSKPYVPPVGPGSKSLPPVGNYRDIDPGLLHEVTKDTTTRRLIGQVATLPEMY
jgi:hypothetical protein